MAVRSLGWLGVRTPAAEAMTAFYRDVLHVEVFLERPGATWFRLRDEPTVVPGSISARLTAASTRSSDPTTWVMWPMRTRWVARPERGRRRSEGRAERVTTQSRTICDRSAIPSAGALSPRSSAAD